MFICMGTGIGNHEKKEVENFDLDTRSMTSFEVANDLWQKIGQSLPKD